MHTKTQQQQQQQRKKEKRTTRECDNAQAEFIETTEIKAGGVRRKDPSRDECKGDSKLATCTAAARSLHSCPTLCDPIDGSPPASPVPGILQARTLEWVAISFSNA